jgi:Domain of unknown function (DUF4287)
MRTSSGVVDAHLATPSRFRRRTASFRGSPEWSRDVTEPKNGPAFDFPSIETTYGRPIDDWQSILHSSGLTTWKELMALVTTDYGMGHGHTDALVIATLREAERKDE